MPDDSPKKDFDVVVMHDKTEDGAGARVLRLKKQGDEAKVEAGEVRPLKEGKPIAGEVISLRPREGAPWVCDVNPPDAAAPSQKKPAQVATNAYRESWERIFGGHRDTSLN